MDWTTFRDQMPVTRQWAYFDHAAVSPLSARAQAALVEWAADFTDNGLAHYGRWLARIEEVRRLVGQLLHADPLDVAFIKNTSEGIGIVAEGLDWRPGDNIVTTEDEYPANIYPWLNIVGRGVELRRVPSRDGRVEIDDLVAAMDGRTRLVTISWVEYASGFRNDLDAIGAACRQRGILFFVDAIQGLGAFPLDVSRTSIDFLAADGHKWLLGPEGAGVFWIRRDLVDRLHPVDIGWHSVVGAWDFAAVDFRLKPNAGRWESGSLNIGGITALGASLQMLLDIGIEALAARILELTERLCDQVQGTSWSVYGPRLQTERSGIVSLSGPPGRPAGSIPALVRELRQQGMVVNHRAGRLRVSPHAYNTHDEVDRLARLLGEHA
jgi:cysteine desulfurase / selenocysteine lyase